MTRYPTIGETVAIHAKLIKRFGGSPGVRDQAVLASALARPQSGHYTDLIQEAAALWESLSRNHAFVDGNERIAMTMTAAFLRVNRYRFEFDDNDASSFLLDLDETGRTRFQEIDQWLRQHVVVINPIA